MTWMSYTKLIQVMEDLTVCVRSTKMSLRVLKMFHFSFKQVLHSSSWFVSLEMTPEVHHPRLVTVVPVRHRWSPYLFSHTTCLLHPVFYLQFFSFCHGLGWMSLNEFFISHYLNIHTSSDLSINNTPDKHLHWKPPCCCGEANIITELYHNGGHEQEKIRMICLWTPLFHLLKLTELFWISVYVEHFYFVWA